MSALVEINQLTPTSFESRFTDWWGRDYLTGRLGVDLAGDERFRPGRALTGWTNLDGIPLQSAGRTR